VNLEIRADPILLAASRRVLEVGGGVAPISFRWWQRRQLLGGGRSHLYERAVILPL